MLSTDYKWGYCRNCVKNVPHHEWHASPLFRFLDEITFRKLRWFRIGPWHCVHCQIGSIYLRRTHNDAVDYPIHEFESESGQHDAWESKQAETVGNFIRTSESLVMRSKRLNRFSEKYRDAVVRRILKGSTTMAQVRQEMDISETELVDWISDIFDRQQARLDAMGNAIELIPQSKIVEYSPEENPETSGRSMTGGFIVDGEVRPK